MIEGLSYHIIAILFAAGVGGGILSSLVGGAAVVIYPALIMAGIPPLQSTACNLTASAPGVILAALSDRSQLPPFNRAFVVMVLAAMSGALIGAVLLTLTPQHMFSLLVPILLGFSTLLFASAGRVGAWIRARAAARGRAVTLNVTDLKLLLPISFYGGYFGAGVGILYLAVLTVVTEGNYRAANVLKNFIGGINTAVAAGIFISQGLVLWPPTLAMMAGTVVGGQIGASLARVLPVAVMRAIVTLVGAVLTVYFAWRFWF